MIELLSTVTVNHSRIYKTSSWCSCVSSILLHTATGGFQGCVCAFVQCLCVCVCVCVCVYEHCVCASQGMMGHRSPVKVAYQSKAALFLPHFIAQILSFILHFIRHIRDGNRPGYKSYNSLSLLWAYTVSDGERTISEARRDLPNAPSFDEKQRAEDAARDIGSRWFPLKKERRISTNTVTQNRDI